jgi:polyketide synthase PksJ
LEVREEDKVLGLTTLCFDISMLEIFLPLIRGATLVMISSKTQKNPVRILEVLREYKVTIMQATPTTYEMLLACGWTGDKGIKFLVGGEACRPKVAQLAGQCHSMYNVYGPTETTIWSSSYKFPEVREGDDSFVKMVASVGVPIGVPISLTSFYVVDENLREVSEGEEGELVIGGDGVALGYLHAPELTVQRFLANPFGEGRIYRTGDLAKKLPDGNYAFGRRMDDQVKVNGYR